MQNNVKYPGTDETFGSGGGGWFGPYVYFDISSSYLQVITRSTMFMLEDVYYLPVGIRTVKVEGTSLLINNKPFYFKGFGKHEDADVRSNLSSFLWDHLKWNV